MSDNHAQAAGSALPNDGSLDAAVASMPDFDDSNLVPFERARDSNMDVRRAPDGRFTAESAPKEPALQVPDPRIAEEQARAAAAASKAAAVDDASSPAEEFFELPPEEEGGEPRRIPATEVFEGYQKAQELAAEIEEVRRGTVPPVEYDRQIMETVQARGRIMQELQSYAQLLQPQEPDLELLNQASPVQPGSLLSAGPDGWPAEAAIGRCPSPDGAAPSGRRTRARGIVSGQESLRAKQAP